MSWVCSDKEVVEAAVINLSKVYKEGGIVGNEPGGVSTLKVNGVISNTREMPPGVGVNLACLGAILSRIFKFLPSASTSPFNSINPLSCTHKCQQHFYNVSYAPLLHPHSHFQFPVKYAA
jgi:hypothetical protein